MPTIAHKPKMLAPAAGDGLGTAFVIAWPCTRKVASVNGEQGCLLERVQFVLRIDPLDAAHAMVEAWLESHSVRTHTLHPSRQHRCQITSEAGMLHIDVRDDAGDALASLSLAKNGQCDGLLYARTSLLAHAGFARGGHDAPALRNQRSEIRGQKPAIRTEH